jgi:glycosyltransferase involved in cell wall biosynthesis
MSELSTVTLAQVTPLILTFNEEANIARTLAGLGWAHRIVVIDSFSTDRTLEILAEFPTVEVVQRRFDSFAVQCNFGLAKIQTPWCLSLDSDHGITPAFASEMAAVLAQAGPDVDAVSTPFRYLVAGRPLRGTLLPPRYNLIRPDGGHYVDDGHAHQFIPSRRTLVMHEPILHDDRKPLARWLGSQLRYVQQECMKLNATPPQHLSFADRLRKRYIIAPFVVLFICLIWQRGVFDGWRGWFYAFQRMYVETLLSLMLWEFRHGKSYL